MKAKIFGFFCSLILLSASVKGQTIDGVLYTNFNNYYKWRGGAFDSTLLIPTIAASIGRRPGALRYNTADSSVYSWTGTQWRKVGDGAAVPTLQQVTTTGNITTDSIISPVFVIDGITSDFAISEDGAGSGALAIKNRNGTYPTVRIGNQLNLKNSAGNATVLLKSSTAANYTTTLPDTTGNLSVGVAANGTTYMAGTNGITNIGNTDTATVVKAYVTNAEAVTITKGQVVYIFGASGDRASVKLAKNTSDTFSSKTLGIVRADIAAGAAGWITTQGQVSGINLGAYSPGDILWLDSVPGGFTATKPQAPYHGVFVGVVERANAGNGLIYVKPQNGVELDELHDVRITSLANNEIIRYNSSLGYWENKSITTTLGYTPLNVTDTTAMLSPYLLKVDTLSLSNRINAISASGGVQWSGVDSSFASELAANGEHEVEEFKVIGTSQTSNAILPGNKWGFVAGSGNYIGFVDNGVNGIRLGTLTSTTAAPYLNLSHTGAANPVQAYTLTSDYIVMTTRIRIPDLSDGTNSYNLRIGMVNSLNQVNIGNGCIFTYDSIGTQTGSSASANWQALTANTNVRTFTNTTTAVSANTWVKLRIVANSSNVFFYVNNTLVATHTTNIPTTNLVPYIDIRKTAGSTARTLEVDYSTIDIKYSTPR
jgi:hypothetical protein